MAATEYLPKQLNHLLTEGVVASTDVDAWIVRVAQHGYQTGQHAGSYSQKDARKVAEAIAAAIPGATVNTINEAYYQVVTRLDMNGATFRSIMEQVGYNDDDTVRHLGISRAMIQKMKTGDRPVPAGIALEMKRMQDAFADARETSLSAAPKRLEIWRDNEASWAETGRPARWHRMIAAECYQEHDTRIDYLDRP